MVLARGPKPAKLGLGGDVEGDVKAFETRIATNIETSLTRVRMAPPSDLQSFFSEESAASKMLLSVPQLKLDFRICVQLNPLIPVGRGPWGQRNWISFQGGQWKATWGEGTVEVVESFWPCRRLKS